MIYVHSVFVKDLKTMLIILRAVITVIKFDIFYAKGASSNNSVKKIEFAKIIKH